MKKTLRIISVLLVLTLAAAVAVPAFATDGSSSDIISAELASVKGGANGIVTFSFDDGYKNEAEALNEICRKYGVRATLFLMGQNVDTPEEVSYWKALISQGYLEAESHAWTATAGANITEDADIQKEIVNSQSTIEGAMGSPVVGYACPSSSISTQAYAVARNVYYAIRSGTVAIQSLDPAVVPSTTARAPAGSWHNLTVIRPFTNPDKNPADRLLSYETIAAYVTQVATSGGWYISLQHGIVNQHSNQEMTRDHFDSLVAHAANLQNEGKVWVATFGEATRYIRERQNSTVTVSGNSISVSMAQTTADGLELDPDVFNMALTVKVTVPNGWSRFFVTRSDGSEELVRTKTEGGKTFGYVDILPGESVDIENNNDPSEYVKGVKQSLTVDEAISYNMYVPKDSKVVTVKIDGAVVEGTEVGEYIRYSTDNVFINNLHETHVFELVLDPMLELDPFVYYFSARGYLDALLRDTGATDDDKQLGYDFLNYAIEAYKIIYKSTLTAYEKVLEENRPTDVKELFANLDALVSIRTAYNNAGFTSIDTSSVARVNEGSLKKALRGVAFTLNEKPYYLIYMKEGFTGTVTITYTDINGTEQVSEFKVVNGHYNLREFIVFEIESVYDLVATLDITASGKMITTGDAVEASGSYSIANYCASKNTDFNRALLAYVVSANAYASDEG